MRGAGAHGRRGVRDGPPTREPAAELVTSLVHTAFQRGLLLLGAGKSALRLAPPLVVNEEDVDTALALLDGILGELD